MEQIKNDKLVLTVSEHGAELQSIKDENGKEYLWDGDEKYWNRHSPILFPLVCGLWKDTYRCEGHTYHLSRHGFARDTDFQLIAKGADRVTFALTESEETLKVYPYHFNLAVTYRLDGNKIHVVWHVENTDVRPIYFQIGGHPAFLVPGAKKGEHLQGRLRFDNPAPQRLYGNTGGCITNGHFPACGLSRRRASTTMPLSLTRVSCTMWRFSATTTSLLSPSTSRLRL